MKIMVSITSWSQADETFLDAVISNYRSEYNDLELQFVLSVNYPFNIPSNAIVLPQVQTGWRHAWNNKEYINTNYKDFDYIIESDADCLITRAAFNYYSEYANRLPIELIPGFLTTELDRSGNNYLVTMRKASKRIREKVTINGVNYIVPENLHSTCFIADRKRYQLALERGLNTTPFIWSFYTEPELARSGIYKHLKKVVAVHEIESGRALVHHLPNKYYRMSFIPGTAEPFRVHTAADFLHYLSTH